MPRHPAPASAIARALGDALTFWLPLTCAGCGTPDVGLCPGCRSALVARPIRSRTESGLTVTSALEFSGVGARVMRALKEEGRTALARDLAPALAAVLDDALAAVSDPGVVVTTIPSSRAAYRRRGFRPVDLLARRAGRRAVPVLTVVRAPRDQRGLGRAARRDNVGGLFRSRPVPGRSIVLVDDVVTTGATLDDAARALRAAGAVRVVAVTLARTPLHTASSGEHPVIHM